MANITQTYSGVTPAVMECLRAKAAGANVTLPAGDSGPFAVSVGPIKVEGSMQYDAASSRLTVTVTKKPFFVTEAQIKNAVDPIIKECL